MFTGSISKSGQMMRIVEIVCLVYYLGTILKALEAVSLILVREHTDDPIAEMDPVSHEEYKEMLQQENIKKSTLFLAQQCSRSDFQSFQGRTFEWIIIEISVYIFFLATLIITMAKSRFFGVGMDNSDQFEPLKMSFMIKQIIKNIDIEGQGEGAETYFVGMERVVMVEGINLKVNLTKEAFDDIKAGKEITKEKAQDWIRDCFVGNISKADLDDERARETNQLDLIQNASILYHTESILEMQMACLVLCFFLDRQWSAVQKYGSYVEPDPIGAALKIGNLDPYQIGRLFMYIFAGEHIMSYSFGMYRDYELKERGKSNEHGVESAPCESRLRCVEIFVDFTIFGCVIFYVLTLTEGQRHNLPFCIYWLLVDMVIMFFTLPYTKLA